ncbi:MAG: tagatose 1,6-diphosphate aldolase [Chloroflexi bacterium]|nr:tagatose 1,6-diphosphate aldolase [Chloroflexota bacterium]
MKQLSIGKYRGLQQCSTPNGALSILALDHRNNLRQALANAGAGAAGPRELSEFKLQVTGALAPSASAVLLDPEFGAAQATAANQLPGGAGLLVSVEATGYTGEPTGRESNLLPGWSVAKIKRMGASAVKMLVYYHPQSPTAKQNEELIKQVAADCAKQDIPFLVEPLSFAIEPGQKKVTGPERHDIVLETARRLTPLGMDILKAEFPLDIENAKTDAEWEKACKALTEASTVPWVLLSAAVDFETFMRQTTIACEQGASGAAVGRAVWKEAVELQGPKREAFLADAGASRMAQVTKICNETARPWTTIYQAEPVDENWYKGYSEKRQVTG